MDAFTAIFAPFVASETDATLAAKGERNNPNVYIPSSTCVIA